MKIHIRLCAFLLALFFCLQLFVLCGSAEERTPTLSNQSRAEMTNSGEKEYISLYNLLSIFGRLSSSRNSLQTAFQNAAAQNNSSKAETQTAVSNKTEAQTVAEKYGLDHDCLLWLARIIYCESRGQPFEGQLAVGTVVMNRVASREFPNTIYSVIFDTKYGVQFTPAGNGSVWCTPDSIALEAARQVLMGYRTDRNILYFMNEAKATSKWIRQSRPFAFKIGDHSFFY